MKAAIAIVCWTALSLGVFMACYHGWQLIVEAQGNCQWEQCR